MHSRLATLVIKLIFIICKNPRGVILYSPAAFQTGFLSSLVDTGDTRALSTTSHWRHMLLRRYSGLCALTPETAFLVTAADSYLRLL